LPPRRWLRPDVSARQRRAVDSDAPAILEPLRTWWRHSGGLQGVLRLVRQARQAELRAGAELASDVDGGSGQDHREDAYRHRHGVAQHHAADVSWWRNGPRQGLRV